MTQTNGDSRNWNQSLILTMELVDIKVVELELVCVKSEVESVDINNFLVPLFHFGALEAVKIHIHKVTKREKREHLHYYIL